MPEVLTKVSALRINPNHGTTAPCSGIEWLPLQLIYHGYLAVLAFFSEPMPPKCWPWTRAESLHRHLKFPLHVWAPWHLAPQTQPPWPPLILRTFALWQWDRYSPGKPHVPVPAKKMSLGTSLDGYRAHFTGLLLLRITIMNFFFYCT